MKSLFFAPRRATESSEPQRATEAFADQLIPAGGVGGYTIDPIDGDSGYTRVGSAGREIPIWTLEKQRAYSVVGYRANPMARAIIDTYVSFCVGDSGVTLQCGHPQVNEVVQQFWKDPKVRLADLQPAFLRDHMLMGETALEMLVGQLTGATRFSPIDIQRVTGVGLDRGNPLWPSMISVRQPDTDDAQLTLAQVDDLTGLRTGEAMFWASWRALLTDRRGSPFLSPILDDLDDYDTVLSNLVDRTALMRYIAMEVTLKGDKVDDEFIADWVRKRGNNQVPKSGTVEVHNESVEYKPLTATTGSMEDIEVDKAILTNIAGGAGLAKTWLADPQDSNRATSLTMAEPVRRRVGGVQNVWIAYQTELVRFAVDQAVAAHRLDAMVEVTGQAGAPMTVPAAQTVQVIGPEIASQNAEVNALVLVNLAQALDGMVTAGIMTKAAAQLAAKKGWESFVGLPYQPELDKPDGSAQDDVAQMIEATPGAGLVAV